MICNIRRAVECGIGIEIHSNPITICVVVDRDLQILDSLGARFLCLNGSARDARTSADPCADAAFEAWVKRHRVHAVLVRPDRFIAARLDPRADLPVLAPFSVAPAPKPAFAAELSDRQDYRPCPTFN